MSVNVTGVVKNSPAYKKDIRKNDMLISVNGHEILDVLDYMFYTADNKLSLILNRDGSEFSCSIIKSEYDDLGLEFSSFLMDEKRSCQNKCVFCFIDQMPPNMRDTLYFKDDDARLSFLQGNYVTLTNLNDIDIRRIIDMRLNINVSVHTTNPELRCKMMNNRFAGEKLKYLKMMTESGLMLNCQIVLCPELNDGAELERTLSDLTDLMPNIQSVAVVPVGLTKFRQNLYELKPFDMHSSLEALDIIHETQIKCLEKYGTRMVFAADEFYLNAELPIPSSEEYEDYPQYENGVGLIRSLIDEFDSALEQEQKLIRNRKISIATGTAAFSTINSLSEKACNKFALLQCNVYAIKNYFFGETITVAGLITGQDLISQMKDKNLGDELLIPKVMLRADSEVFLDDVTVSDVEKELNVKVRIAPNDGYELLNAILGLK